MNASSKLWFWLLIIGFILFIIALVALLMKNRSWWVWTMLILGVLLLIIGGIIWSAEKADEPGMVNLREGIRETSGGIEKAFSGATDTTSQFVTDVRTTIHPASPSMPASKTTSVTTTVPVTTTAAAAARRRAAATSAAMQGGNPMLYPDVTAVK